jgi:hypothetical protein
MEIVVTVLNVSATAVVIFERVRMSQSLSVFAGSTCVATLVSQGKGVTAGTGRGNDRPLRVGDALSGC